MALLPPDVWDLDGDGDTAEPLRLDVAGGEVEVTLYDVLGRRVAVLHEGALAAGRHEWPIEAGLVPGVYVVRAAAGGAVVAYTATLLR